MIEFDKYDYSIIKNEFYGIESSIYKCSNCQNVNSSSKPLYYFNFNLEEIIKSKGKNPLKIIDCFEYLKRLKKNDEKNYVYNKCKKKNYRCLS